MPEFMGETTANKASGTIPKVEARAVVVLPIVAGPILVIVYLDHVSKFAAQAGTTSCLQVDQAAGGLASDRDLVGVAAEAGDAAWTQRSAACHEWLLRAGTCRRELSLPASSSCY